MRKRNNKLPVLRVYSITLRDNEVGGFEQTFLVVAESMTDAMRKIKKGNPRHQIKALKEHEEQVIL